MKNELLQNRSSIIRILDVQNGKVLTIDCIKRTMPSWKYISEIYGYMPCCLQDLLNVTGIELYDINEMDVKSRQVIHYKYNLIASLLPIVGDSRARNKEIRYISISCNVSPQTIRNYLCLYLVYQDISILSPKKNMTDNALTKDEKNMRWALNKFFYTKNKNSLNTAYTFMLKEKYCDGLGNLLPEYPTFNQFRYFYRKTRKMQTYYISRNGLKNYQRNNRPLLGSGVQEFASNVGVCMLDATICDIYLVNESGGLVGRPILVAAIDGYSSLCCGYSLLWEGGVYSLRGLMLNILEDKQSLCRKHGILIEAKQWDCSGHIPGVLVSDMGSEYKSENFEQIAELGCTVINLPAYRPELKGSVEKFFDVLQNLFKPHLKGKGVIETDFQERGSHDYRKDACLTIADFEKVILKCIIYYNSQRIVENFPYTEIMMENNIQPYACDIWEWGKSQTGSNLIPVDKELLILTLLPRTIGRFTRSGLVVNKLRYKHEKYTEKYLSGGEVTIAYSPEDVSYIWLIDNGKYIRFELAESRFKGKRIEEVQSVQCLQKKLVKANKDVNRQAQIDLATYINVVASGVFNDKNTNIKEIRKNRKKEEIKTHINFAERVCVYDE